MTDLNNKQTSTNEEIPLNKKNNRILKAFAILFAIVLFLCASIYFIYVQTINISDKYTDKFDYDLNCDKVITDYNYLDFIKYNSKEDINNLSITVPKDCYYDDIVEINEAAEDINAKYGIKINKIGTISNIIQNNSIDFYTDITYKNTLNAYVYGTVKYEFTDNNGIKLYLTNIVVGDGCPSLFYKSILPVNIGDLLYEFNPKNYKYLDNDVINLKYLNNIKINKTSLKFKYDYMSNLENISNYLLKDRSDILEKSLENLMPIVLESLIGDNKEEFSELSTILIPNLKEIINIFE